MGDGLVICVILISMFIVRANPTMWGDLVKAWLVIAILGFYTKYTMLTTIPAFAIAIYLSYAGKDQMKKTLKTGLVIGAIFALAISPIIIRNYLHYKTPLALADQFYPANPNRSKRDIEFFTNMHWVMPPDLFAANKYSLIGGTWNSFWDDGYQVSTPVTSFHKKALVLWLLGFFLAPLSIYGLYLLWKNQLKVAIVLIAYLATAVISYVLYNLHLPYPTELKAFFMSGLPIVYLMGLASAYTYASWTRKWLFGLIAVQLFTTISYFWIQPWWHLVK
jgi:hypothetical protein